MSVSPTMTAPAPALTPARREGTMLADKWRIERTLGVGAIGTVYAATHRNGSRVAVKVMHPSRLSDVEAVARFRKEGRVGNLVRHPGIVKSIDDGVLEDGTPYSVMELLEGETLASVLRRGAMPLSDATRIFDEVLAALEAMHEVGIVHRDIKPDNVFITRASGVKLLDFGIARDPAQTGVGATANRVLLGTPAFMPPEQANARWSEVDARSDIWSVGATLFTALTGRRVHAGSTTLDDLFSAMDPTPPVQTLAPSLPAAMCAILDLALAHDPSRRFATATAMRTALRSAFGKPNRTDLPQPADDVHERDDATAGGTLPSADTHARTAGVGRRGWQGIAGGILLASLATAIATAFWVSREPARLVIVLPDPPGYVSARSVPPARSVLEIPPTAIAPSSALVEPPRTASAPIRRAAPTTALSAPRGALDPMDGRY